MRSRPDLGRLDRELAEQFGSAGQNQGFWLASVSIAFRMRRVARRMALTIRSVSPPVQSIRP